MKLRTTLTKYIAIISGIAVILTIICCCFAAWNTFSQQAYNDLKEYGNLVCSYLNNDYNENINMLQASGYRITIINKDGSIIYESNKKTESEMDNHINRPEVSEALKTGTGKSVRYSFTMNKIIYYYAIKLNNGNILRVSNEARSIFGLYICMSVIIIFLGIYVFLICIIFSSRFTKKVIKPFEDMKFNERDKIYEELKPFADKISQQSIKIKHQFEYLQEEQDKIKTLISNMQEGFIMFDVDKVILIENESARKMLKPRYKHSIGRNVLEVYHDDKIINSINRALKGESLSAEIAINKKTLKLFVNPVYSSGEMLGIICLLLDVTVQKRNEKLRKDFTANVTHELKTPLTSISGYAEMIENGMVTKSEDMQKFAGRIHKEAGRLITLISDIMKLSKMDNNVYQLEGIRKVNLKDTVTESIEILEVNANKRNISIETQLSDVTFIGNETQLYELVFNLCDNAIRYNKDNGKVLITLKKENENPVLIVKDTGIGIAQKHIERIFERFYRVDKSRSKETGGTGLGLAIVKHIAEAHNAEIFVESEPNVGTEIKVLFHSKHST